MKRAVRKCYCGLGFSVFLALTGCGGTGQDDGVVQQPATIRGVAVDGYLAGALCYLDLNDNYKRDAFEPSALTDSQGYYSYNPDTGINYCASDATQSQAEYCLSALTSATDAVLRCRGGYDLLTEEPFEGTLSTRLNVVAGSSVESVVVSPLTTLVASADSEAEKAHILSVLNVASASELQVDYLAERNSALLQVALRLQKAAQILAEPIRATHDGSNDAVIDPVGQVYEAFLDYFVSNTDAGIATVLSDSNALSTVAQMAESLFVNAEKQISDDTQVGKTTVRRLNQTQSGRRAVQVAQVVNTLCNDLNSDETFSDIEIKRCARATEVVLKKAVKELKQTNFENEDTSIDTAVSCLTDSSCDSVLQVLGNDNFDLSAIQEDSFASPEATAAAVIVAGDAAVFSNLAGKSVRVNDPDNDDPSRQKHARLELYFGEAGTTSGGPLTACVRYLEGVAAANPNRATDEDIQDGDTRGTFVSGTWAALGSSGYSVVLTLRLTETSKPYTAIMKSAGSNGQGQAVFRFDFDDGLENWYSVNGLETAPNVLPASNTSCRERFNTVSDSAS